MATAGSDPQWLMSSLQSSSRTGAQWILPHSEKERQSCWSSFPMGQRPKGTFHKASSYLLQQLIHRSQESDADGEEDEGEGEVESEESSESEMLNLEVCLPPHPLAPFSSRRTPLLRRPLPHAPHPHEPPGSRRREHLSLTVPRLLLLSSRFLTLCLPYFQVSPFFFFFFGHSHIWCLKSQVTQRPDEKVSTYLYGELQL